MNSRLRLLAFAVVVAVSDLTAGTALSQDKEKIVTERQEAMKQQGREMVAVRNYFQNKGDQAAAIAAMDGLQKSLPMVVDWFPPGTGIGEVSVKTRAKPEIWQEHDKFLAADRTVIGLVAQLDTAVKSGDKAKVEAAFNEVKFCAACH